LRPLDPPLDPVEQELEAALESLRPKGPLEQPGEHLPGSRSANIAATFGYSSGSRFASALRVLAELGDHLLGIGRLSAGQELDELAGRRDPGAVRKPDGAALAVPLTVRRFRAKTTG
jgi:hypothetical protein